MGFVYSCCVLTRSKELVFLAVSRRLMQKLGHILMPSFSISWGKFAQRRGISQLDLDKEGAIGLDRLGAYGKYRTTLIFKWPPLAIAAKVLYSDFWMSDELSGHRAHASTLERGWA
jgi:hypothetical protein